ncbi:MAG: hypothetical protein BJ554DRAFT_5723 [Olpidium bornovanus]|uniref:Uncharacterized protein n=1 Tax=Olpidium bornovanus TaxID=278681 RepID=A0A8H7ZZ70_9FUNG|nr:MAG: hypothetical protein BJ554DRAFT_5723 [Olpidium bornovanus]
MAAAADQMKSDHQEGPEADLTVSTRTSPAAAGGGGEPEKTVNDGDAQAAIRSGIVETADEVELQIDERVTIAGESNECDAAAKGAPTPPTSAPGIGDMEREKGNFEVSALLPRDNVSFIWHIHSAWVSIGRARYCVADPLFRPEIAGKPDTLPLPDAIHCSLMACDADKRATCFSNVVITGGHAALKGIRERLALELGRFSNAADVSADTQLREPRFGRIPEYFAAVRTKDQFASFLGAEICGKVGIFPEEGWLTFSLVAQHVCPVDCAPLSLFPLVLQ